MSSVFVSIHYVPLFSSLFFHPHLVPVVIDRPRVAFTQFITIKKVETIWFCIALARVKIDYGSNKSTKIAVYFIYQFSNTAAASFGARFHSCSIVAVERDWRSIKLAFSCSRWHLVSLTVVSLTPPPAQLIFIRFFPFSYLRLQIDLCQFAHMYFHFMFIFFFSIARALSCFFDRIKLLSRLSTRCILLQTIVRSMGKEKVRKKNDSKPDHYHQRNEQKNHGKHTSMPGKCGIEWNNRTADSSSKSSTNWNFYETALAYKYTSLTPFPNDTCRVGGETHGQYHSGTPSTELSFMEKKRENQIIKFMKQWANKTEAPFSVT